MPENSITTIHEIEQSIFIIRGQRVMLDSDLDCMAFLQCASMSR